MLLNVDGINKLSGSRFPLFIFISIIMFPLKLFGLVLTINGEILDGVFLNGYKNGFGIMNYSIGRIYEGEWLNDEIRGKGILKYEDMQKKLAEDEAAAK